MDALTVAAANSKEIIGKGLLDSIAALGGEDGISKAADNMETLAQNVADTVYGFTLLISKAEQLIRIADKGKGSLGLIGATAAGALGGFAVGGPGGALVGGALGLTGARATQLTGQYGKTQREKNTPFSPTSMYFTVETAERAKLVATIKKENSLVKEKNKMSAAELAAKKKQDELEALKKKFDVDRINLETALANSKDEAEKARIRSLLTIMDEDANGAAKRLAELDKSNSDKMRQEYLAAISLGNLAEAARLAALGVAGLTLGGAPILGFQQRAISEQGIADPLLAEAVFIEAERAQREAEAALDRSTARANYAETVNNITINTPIGSEEYLTEAMQRALQKLNRYGDSTTFAGAL
jgi:hypothetical protein